MTQRPFNRGLTLLEVILAVTLTVGVVSSATVFCRHALDARRALECRMQEIEAHRLIMDRITNELRSAVFYGFLGLGVEGSSQQMQFVSAALPGPAVWAVRKAHEAPIPPEDDLRLLGYGLRGRQDPQTPQAAVEGLERTCQKLLAVAVAEEGQAIQSTLLSSQIEFIAFRYWHQGGWLESFGGGLPLAVEITLGFAPLPPDTAVADYPYPACRRVVYLPAAGKEQPGAVIIRGLEGAEGP